MKTKFRLLELHFKDGNLTERMTAEGLPAELRTYLIGTAERPVYECSAELLKAMAASGLEYEVIENDPFEGTAKINVPGSRGLTSYRRANKAHKTIRRIRS